MTIRDQPRDVMLVTASLFELATAIGVVAYWVLFFTSSPLPFVDPERAQDYFAFESAFPAADAVLVVALVLGGVGLLRRAAFGPPLSLAAAGALVFLGLLDLTFNARQGIYRLTPGAAFVNLVCVVGGALLTVLVWRHRSHWSPLDGEAGSPGASGAARRRKRPAAPARAPPG